MHLADLLCAPRRRQHRNQLRHALGPADARRARTARQAHVHRRRAARPALEPAVRRHRRAARHQRKLRHARRRPGHRADRRPAAQAPAAEFRGRAHLRRSLRGRHALGDRRGGDVRRRPARRRHAPAHRRRRRALPSVDQPRASRRSAAATAISAVRSPKPSPPARRPRIAAAIASRSFQENDVSIIRRFTDINVATDVRAALAENRLRLEAQMILPFVDGPHAQAALRAAAAHARSGRQHHRTRIASCRRRCATR